MNLGGLRGPARQRTWRPHRSSIPSDPAMTALVDAITAISVIAMLIPRRLPAEASRRSLRRILPSPKPAPHDAGGVALGT